jgi:membrane protein YqaA with SNARE-associated domain
MGESSMPDAGAAPGPAAETPEAQLRLAQHEPLRLRDWFVPFGLVLAVAAGVYFATGRETTAGGAALLFAYLSVACTFLPLPTTWIVIWAASPADGGGLGIHPLLVATVAALGTAAANMHDYYLLTFLYRYRPVQRVRATALYRKVAAWYNRAPFGTLAAASFLPIPIDFVRLLAISEGYSRRRFAVGSLVGRWPRYLLFAVLADQFRMGWQWAVGAAGAAVVLGLWRGLPPLVKRLREHGRACKRPPVPRAGSPDPARSGEAASEVAAQEGRHPPDGEAGP